MPLRSPSVSLVDADLEALDAAEDMVGEQFCWLATLLNWFQHKRGFDAICKVGSLTLLPVTISPSGLAMSSNTYMAFLHASQRLLIFHHDMAFPWISGSSLTEHFVQHFPAYFRMIERPGHDEEQMFGLEGYPIHRASSSGTAFSLVAACRCARKATAPLHY